MSKNKKILTVLNSLLSDELTTINQYMVHSEMCENWGYNKLYAAIRKHAMEEMQHAVWLIERIFFYDGSPTISKLKTIKSSRTVSDIISNDNYNKFGTVYAYNNAIKLARDNEDQGTIDMLTKILKVQEVHVGWGKVQHAQIEKMGMENYLINQTEFLAN